MSDLAKHIIEEIKQLQNVDKAKWLENYVKHDIKSFGVGIPEIREIVQIFEKENQISSQQISLQIQLLDDLMGNEFTEPKLAAIIFIQLYWKTNKPTETLQLTSKWLENGWITDWNVCDWLCVRLLSPLVDKEPQQTILEFEKWNTSTNLWRARASLVPFAQCKTIEKHINIILTFSECLIKRDERFCKTAVGWILRQYSKINEKFVIEFLERNKNWTTKEVIKNATKYL
jgi:3-methyladenine DNA glycosylase AlkD